MVLTKLFSSRLGTFPFKRKEAPGFLPGMSGYHSFAEEQSTRTLPEEK